jgi:hypothetical protein
LLIALVASLSIALAVPLASAGSELAAISASPPEQVLGAGAPPLGASVVGGSEATGSVNYRLDAASYFDRFAHKAGWIKRHINSLLAYPTFGDVYPQYGRPVVGYHDPATEGQYPLEQPQINAYVTKVRRDIEHGYAGTFVDDANWSFSPSPGPEANLANLIESLRGAFPSAQIQINSQFWDIWPKMKEHDPNVERALRFVNVVTKEFGVGPTAGINSPSAYREFFEYVDALHAKGIHLWLMGDPNNNNVPTMEYNLATYFLLNDGGDFVAGVNQTPRHWWRGFRVDLGAALGPRERSTSGVWSRRFAKGLVYTVEPGAATQTISLGERFHSAEWGSVTSVTLAPGEGAVLTH